MRSVAIKILPLAVVGAVFISCGFAYDFRADEAQVRSVLSEFTAAYRGRDLDHLATLAYPRSPIIFHRVRAGSGALVDLALMGLVAPLEYNKRHPQALNGAATFRDIRPLSLEYFRDIFSRYQYCFLKLAVEDVVFTSESSCWIRARSFSHIHDPESDNFSVRMEPYNFVLKKREGLWLVYGVGAEVAESDQDKYYLAIRGDKYLLEGRIDEAIADFKKAIGIDPAFSIAYFELGLAYIRDERWMQSHPEVKDFLSSMQKAVASEPDIPLYHDFLAFGYQGKGQLRQAQLERARILQLDPGYPLVDYRP